MGDEIMTPERAAIMRHRTAKKMTKKMKIILEERLKTQKNKCAQFCKELADAKDKGQEVEEYQRVLEGELDSKLGAAQMAFDNAEIVSVDKQKNVITIGSQVVICNQNGDETKLIVDGGTHKEGEVYIIDYISPVGRQLLGKKLGDKVMAGKTEMTIAEIDYQW
ncbi:MAG: GreA/GreB family elongation factor [Candidatus Falkowbacteria bacterium]